MVELDRKTKLVRKRGENFLSFLTSYVPLVKYFTYVVDCNGDYQLFDLLR